MAPPAFEELDDLLSGSRARRDLATTRWVASFALFVTILAIGVSPLVFRLRFFVQRIEKGSHPLRDATFRGALVGITMCVAAGQLLGLVFTHLLPTASSHTLHYERFGSGTDIAVGFLLSLVFHELVSIRFSYPDTYRLDPWYSYIVHFIRRELNVDKTIPEQPAEHKKAKKNSSGEPEQKKAKDNSRPRMNSVVFFGVTMLSLDSMLEGLCLGLQPSIQDTWRVFGSLLVYKASVVVSTTAELMASNFASQQIATVVFIISIMQPAGSLFGASVDHSGVTRRNLGLLLGVSAGKLLYLIFFEMLRGYKTKHLRRLAPVLATCMGFILFTGPLCLVP